MTVYEVDSKSVKVEQNNVLMCVTHSWALNLGETNIETNLTKVI